MMCATLTTPSLTTARLILREPVKSDAQALCRLADDMGVAGRLASMPHPYRLADAEAFLGRARDWDRAPDFAVEHREFGFIGMVGFAENAPGRVELGYWLGRPFWGRGYATEAAKAALKWARHGWGRKVVWAHHHLDNHASGQVLVKAGFLYTGEVTLRDCKATGEEVPSRTLVWLA